MCAQSFFLCLSFYFSFAWYYKILRIACNVVGVVCVCVCVYVESKIYHYSGILCSKTKNNKNKFFIAVFVSLVQNVFRKKGQCPGYYFFCFCIFFLVFILCSQQLYFATDVCDFFLAALFSFISLSLSLCIYFKLLLL